MLPEAHTYGTRMSELRFEQLKLAWLQPAEEPVIEPDARKLPGAHPSDTVGRGHLLVLHPSSMMHTNSELLCENFEHLLG